MKIVGFETFPVSVPYTHAERSSRVQRGGVSDVIVKLTTDTGLVGWGESCCGADTASIDAALQAMKPFVVGRDPWDTEAIARDVYKIGLWDYRINTGNFAFAGIDMALWDLCGKDCGQPLYRLFGGAVREEVDYFCYLAVGTPEERRRAVPRRRRARLRAASTSRSASTPPPRRRCSPPSAPRSARPEDPHRRQRSLDAGRGDAAPDALERALRHRFRRGAGAGAFRRTSCRSCKEQTPVALCANEGLGSEADVLRTIAARRGRRALLLAAIGSGRCAASTRSRISRTCTASASASTRMASSGLAAAAGQHMLLTLPNAVDGAQQTAAIMDDDILDRAAADRDRSALGRIERPGLGVEVDEDKLRHYARGLPTRRTVPALQRGRGVA